MDWPEKRARLVQDLRDTQKELWDAGPSGKRHTIPERRKLRTKFDRRLMEYAQNLPREALSRCPVCETPLEVRIDTIGVDGPWWWSTCPIQWGAPEACEHFQVFLGAMDFHGREPAEVEVWTVFPGPGAPFVIARLLAMEGMQAVISTVQLRSGDTGYLIAYFSSVPVPPALLHQEWRLESRYISDGSGGAVEDVVDDAWDFELSPWLEQGKLLWIAPNDPDLTLNEGTACPYRGLEGTHRKQVVVKGGIRLNAPPEGGETGLYKTQDGTE